MPRRNAEQFRLGGGGDEHLAIHLETGPAPPSGGRIPARSDRIFVSDLSFTRKRAPPPSPSSLPPLIRRGARGDARMIREYPCLLAESSSKL